MTNSWLLWRSKGAKTAVFGTPKMPQFIVGKFFTFRMSAPSMRQKMSIFCPILKCNTLKIRRLIFAKWLWNFLYFPPQKNLANP